MLESVSLELDDKCLFSSTAWRCGAQIDEKVSRQRASDPVCANAFQGGTRFPPVVQRVKHAKQTLPIHNLSFLPCEPDALQWWISEHCIA